jgi:hypothetical protein
VLIIGDKGTETLQHLRNTNLVAAEGGNGTRNLMHGANARPLQLRVPLGTLAYDARNGVELGSVTAAGQQLVVARGGKGGRGNAQFKTATNRAPKAGQPGMTGVVRDLLLRYRIYGHCGLIEAPQTAGALLPALLGRDAAQIDFALYFKGPRWIRVEHEFQRFDPVYLPVGVGDDGAVDGALLHHAYWLESLFINLAGFGDELSAAAESLSQQLAGRDLPRLEKLTVAVPQGMEQAADVFASLDSEELTTVTGEPDVVYAGFLGTLAGGTV